MELPEVAIGSFLYSYEAVIQVALVNVLLCYSLYVVFRAGMWSLHQAGAMALAAYPIAYLEINHGWPLWQAILVVVPISALVVAVLVAPALRLQGVYLAIATIALSEAIRIGAINLDVTGGAGGLVGLVEFVTLGALSIVVLVAAAAMITFDRSRWGRASLVHAKSAVLTQSLGTNLLSFRMSLVFVSSLLAGLGAALATGVTPIVEPAQFSFDRVVELLAFMVVGGLRSALGPVVGVVALTLPVEVFEGLAEYRLFFYGVVILLVLLFIPRGLAPSLEMRWLGDWLARLKARLSTSNPGVAE